MGNYMVIMNDELTRMWKESVVAYFKLPPYMFEGTKENHI